MYDEDEFDFETEDDLSGSDLVKKLRKQVSEMSKALKERDSQLEEFYTVSREQSIASALEEIGVNPRIAAFIPDEIEDMDGLQEWLGEYGDVFGVTYAEDDGYSVDQEVVNSAELMSAIEEDGYDPQIGLSLEAQMNAATTREELAAILNG